MRTAFLICLVLLLPFSLALPQQAQAPRAEKKELFSGVLSLVRPQASKVDVGVHLWVIRGGQRHDSLDTPPKATLVAQVRAGSLTTIINGRRQERREGEFWTLAPGVRMGVETGQDTAILQTVVVAE